jgi:UDP-N-acetylglucosamine acyltransferase
MIIDQHFGKVSVHPDAHVESTAVLIGPCTIGEGAYVGHYAVIGSPAQHKGHYPDGDHHRPKGVRLGYRAVVREHCQVQQGVKRETAVWQEAYVMAGTHVSHDTIIGAYATIGTNSIFGGHTVVMRDVTLGQKVVTHPWVIIGPHAMVGQGSCVIRDVLPHQKVAGNPARLLGRNTGAGGEKEAWLASAIPSNDRIAWTFAEQHREEQQS